MSADQRPSQTPEPQTNREQTGAAATDVELEFRSSAASTEAHSNASSTPAAAPDSTTAREPPLSHRIERTALRARVTALERALETSESRQQEIVTQYERVLAERTDETQDGSSTGSADADDGLLRRLLERWR
ncbi:hypothetical protein [Halopiger xanaduensis]|uniref:Uncharacterized protein n=1 Tax=Halopiger xanaduensis (strain DSM 18323 / JCM 14033 / SH-6) TaxID=797210 RepID=F8DCH6_HALXS|nr:hypothetical protein [Halopiger xanaduensis]AEH36018.1 hypothetical protein Halxa_1385 [Halopiger xanaduensis SH-6]